MSTMSRLDSDPAAKAAYLANEARAAIGLAAAALWSCVRCPGSLRCLLRGLVRWPVRERRSEYRLTAAEIKSLRELLS